MAPGMVDYDHALPREAPLDADLTGGPVDVADQGAERGARTTPAAPPPAPAPPSVGELMAVAVRPDAGAEFTSLRAELEAGLGRPLNGAELAQLTGLALARAAALERLERQQQLRALYDAQLAALQAQRDAALDAEVYEQPSYLDELATEAWEGGPVRIVRDIGHGFVALVERSGELQREAIGRGDYRGAAFAAPAAIVEQTVQTFGSISDNLRMTTEAIERVMEWRSTTDGIIGSTEAVLGIGMAMLEAWSLVEPVASLRRGGAATGGARLALVEAGAGSRAGQIAAAGAAVAEGSLARPAIVLTIARLRDADADALGDGPEADAVNEVDEARPGQEPEPEVQSEQAREPEVQSEQEPHPPRSRRNGETRNGIKRNNTADWRRIRETWDEAGYGAALSPANRTRITKGRTPIVDDAWIEWFPGDAALRGEKISIHHIKGGKLNVPLPKSRHQDAHMPGGFQTNPGGPGMTGALEEEDHGNRFA
jgi:hypothetical protein